MTDQTETSVETNVEDGAQGAAEGAPEADPSASTSPDPRGEAESGHDDDVAALRREHKLAQALSGPHDLVFVGRTGRGHDHRNIGGRVLARAVKREG